MDIGVLDSDLNISFAGFQKFIQEFYLYWVQINKYTLLVCLFVCKQNKSKLVNW